MEVLTAEYFDLIHVMPEGDFLVFDDVSWEEYERLLDRIGEDTRFRVSYDVGRMQVMTVSKRHERYDRLLEHLVVILADELEMECDSCGSMTMRAHFAGKGTEPDGCFYLHNAERTRGNLEFDPLRDPPPDLALEIDVTHGSMSKLPIYAGLGVPEVWRYDGMEVEFFALTDDHYVRIDCSDLFPFLEPGVVADFISDGVINGDVAVRRAFREWVKVHKND